VAALSGFSSSQYFCEVFVSPVGSQPIAYRKRSGCHGSSTSRPGRRTRLIQTGIKHKVLPPRSGRFQESMRRSERVRAHFDARGGHDARYGLAMDMIGRRCVALPAAGCDPQDATTDEGGDTVPSGASGSNNTTTWHGRRRGIGDRQRKRRQHDSRRGWRWWTAGHRRQRGRRWKTAPAVGPRAGGGGSGGVGAGGGPVGGSACAGTPPNLETGVWKNIHAPVDLGGTFGTTTFAIDPGNTARCTFQSIRVASSRRTTEDRPGIASGHLPALPTTGRRPPTISIPR
jgi:hypothetical protein